MALIQEDGTGREDAQTYASAADLVAFAGLRGISVPSTEEGQEQLLIAAMDALEEFATRWKGERVSASQALAWPRMNVVIDGRDRPSNELPRELQYAQLQLALEAANADLMPNDAQQQQVTKEKVGPIEVSYENKGRVLGVSAFAKPMALIRPLLKSGLTLIRS